LEKAMVLSEHLFW